MKLESCIINDRKSYLEKARLIVVKIGSAVLADKSGLDQAVLEELAAQLAQVREALAGRRIIVVSSGAVAAGRGILAAHGRPQNGSSRTIKQALAAIGQGSLMSAWTRAFAKFGIVTAQALLTRDDFHSRERFQHVSDAFSEMLVWDVAPIVNENDTVAVHELQFGDNDTLASLLVNLVGADLFINLTSAPGVKAVDPSVIPDAPLLRSIDNIRDLDIEGLCGAKTVLGSGGMYSKLLAARRVAQLGVPTLILPGRQKDALLKAFALLDNGEGEEIGTWVCPNTQIIPRRKFWLAYQAEPQGTVEIDQGAAQALVYNGKSLLPGGITSIEGEFAKGDLIAIHFDGNIIGVGFSNYSSNELLKIYGRKRHEIAAILGDAHYRNVIHRDNMLLDAAVASPCG